MWLKHVDLDAALRRLADRKIEQAMRDGKFDNLPGRGQPLELEPMPAEENARLTWWALKLLRQNDFIPEEVRWRKTIDRLRDQLAVSESESAVRRLVAQINALVFRINTLGANALQGAVTPLQETDELEKMRARQQDGPAT
jgi:hypothetical protein